MLQCLYRPNDKVMESGQSQKYGRKRQHRTALLIGGVHMCLRQGAQEMQVQAEDAAEAAAAEVAAVRAQHAESAAELGELLAERERWQADWDAERARLEAERAAVLALLEVGRQYYPFWVCPGRP